jgi:7,8-dihydro-6-hydroxymethylpterin dimethyltransferase
VERVALTFCYRDGERFVPITRRLDLREHLPVINNTFAFDADEYLAQSAGVSEMCDCMSKFVERLRPLIPRDFGSRTTVEKVGHFNRNMFRISVSSFVDMYNFDLKSMQRECVHVITRDLRRIPFSAYNMFHRGP